MGGQDRDSDAEFSDDDALPGDEAGLAEREDNDGAAVAVAISPGFMLAGVTNVKYADGAHEIELRPADIDIGAVFYKLEGVVSPHEVVPGRVGASEPERAACCGGLIKERG